ncbi:PDR/VanB family oxidoreductase [Halomonas smyrnensis]|uniref:PDR/VanB family oxidoreductase n=1 Tax=Halomonas smyrnensis TaxID=720605 RepID=UPI0002F8A2F4|nr:PDR/VanB family oxidoreductase [Halomonas smyrnensis]
MIDTVRGRLVKKEPLSSDICSFTFESIGSGFTGLEAGSHVDVVLGPELIRNYSVWEWGEGGDYLSVAVKREDDGRGGSIAMHELAVGAEVKLGGPRNNFPIVSDSQPIVLIGGGIGITPIYAMACALQQAGRDFEVYYLVRSHEMAAFDPMFKKLELGDCYHLHCDDTDGFVDFGDLIGAHPAETHYYVCGPEALLEIIRKASADHERGTVFFERFSPVNEERSNPNSAFEVIIHSSQEIIRVMEDQSILSALRDRGYTVDFSCSNGLCGSCITDVLEGEIDHRDSVLDDEERDSGDCMCICVSRAISGRLVLDL